MRRARGFTLVELLVALFVLALMAMLSWRGIDGMVRARQVTEARADEVLALQTGLAQWAADLDTVTAFPPAAALDWNGRVLRLTRRSSLSPADGVRVVGWTLREGQWRRWESRPVATRGDLEAAWAEAGLWAQNPSDAMRQGEVAIAPLAGTQVAMLTHLATVVRPGGRIIYSTCSSEPEENEQVVEAFLAGHRNFTRATPAVFTERPELAGLLDAAGALKTLPFRDGLEAFYAVSLRRA